MRDIERTNRILLQKILSKGPASTSTTKSKNVTSVSIFVIKILFITMYINCRLQRSENMTRVSSAAVNRKKQQRQIDFDNQVLRRKIEEIARRK